MKKLPDLRAVIAALIFIFLFSPNFGTDFCSGETAEVYSSPVRVNNLRQFPGTETVFLPPGALIPGVSSLVIAPRKKITRAVSGASSGKSIVLRPQKIKKIQEAHFSPAPSAPPNPAPLNAVPASGHAEPVLPSKKFFVSVPVKRQRVRVPRAIPVSAIRRTLNAIQNRFDREKYNAFKIFSGETETRRSIHAGASESELLRLRTEEYSGALNANRLKARKRMSGLVYFLRKTSRVLSVSPDDLGTANLFFSSFSRVTVSRASHRLIVFTAKQFERFFDYSSDRDHFDNICRFLRNNCTPRGLPLSYSVPDGYWESVKSPMTRVDSVLERVLMKYSVNIYDAAVWQIALTLADSSSAPLVDAYTGRLISGRSGRIRDLRAYDGIFQYGEGKKALDKDTSYFFRMIADEYIQSDPLGENEVDGYPNFKTVHHEDWKPITGEQAWAAIIGPLQVAYLKYQGEIPLNSPEMKLALSILPAVRAMQSRIGAIYHAPHGTAGKNPNDISNENNFSMYSAFKMLIQVLEQQDPKKARIVKGLLREQELYFRQYAFDHKNKIFFQGGHYVNGVFIPTRIFAVDCQTWAIAALGVDWIDRSFGEGTAYRIWKNTVSRGGYFDAKGVLRGVGFTDDHRVLSTEWTGGAILATRLLAKAYKKSHPAWAAECAQNARTMRQGLESMKKEFADGSAAYLYANQRYFIPFSWWANPAPSLVSSSWIVLVDLWYNPFILGGGPYFKR